MDLKLLIPILLATLTSCATASQQSLAVLDKDIPGEAAASVATSADSSGFASGGATAASALANDNRDPAGDIRDGVLELRLEARAVAWQPGDPDSETMVLAFGEEGKPASIPGPLLRVKQGSEVRITVRNSVPEAFPIGLPPPNRRREGLKSTAGPVLAVHGLRAGTVSDDTVTAAPGQVVEVRFRAERPGTYLYWGAMSNATMRERTGRDAQLTGAIIVDPAGVKPDPDERIFVITMTDAFADESGSPVGEDLFRLAINGLSWPHTERLHQIVGETVRWRWLNGSGFEHPMHLHGFHFRTLARGDAHSETSYSDDAIRHVVTELMEPGGTFRMDWTPTRAGNWILHCHILTHVTPEVARTEEMRAHELHDVTQHPLTAMAGLVLGITVSEDASSGSVTPAPRQRLRLVARERFLGDGGCSDNLELDGRCAIRGFGLEDGKKTQSDTIDVPGPALVLTRGETAEITIVNRLSEPTTVHWHGMELESVYDGVAGWSRTGSRIAPLIAPGESFTVYITPPRSGTFIYHTHMDETDQLRTGMYGPLIVLEPGETFDRDRDRVFVIGSSVEGWLTVNGRRQPAPEVFRVGNEYRLRLINIHDGATANIQLSEATGPVLWRSLAKDGADLAAGARIENAARVRMGVGETYDFVWVPTEPGDATLRFEAPFGTFAGQAVLNQTLRVEPRQE